MGQRIIEALEAGVTDPDSLKRAALAKLQRRADESSILARQERERRFPQWNFGARLSSEGGNEKD
jgi:hypothetical protein